MMEALKYTPEQVSSFLRKTEGIKVYLGGAAAFRDALDHCYDETTREVFYGTWTAALHCNTAIRSSNFTDGSESDDAGEDDEIYGVIFDGDGNFISENNEAASSLSSRNNKGSRRKNDEDSSSSDEISGMSEELVDFSETDSVDYAAQPCQKASKSGCIEAKDSNIQAPVGDNCNDIGHFAVDTRYSVDCDAGAKLDGDKKHLVKINRRRNENENSSNDSASGDTGNPGCTNKPVNSSDRRSNDQTAPSRAESSVPDVWHSRRTSLDVIKKRTQLKQNKVAAAIQKQYKRINSFTSTDDGGSSRASKLPRLKFMAAPGVKDKKKKQMTLIGMFKK